MGYLFTLAHTWHITTPQWDTSIATAAISGENNVGETSVYGVVGARALRCVGEVETGHRSATHSRPSVLIRVYPVARFFVLIAEAIPPIVGRRLVK